MLLRNVFYHPGLAVDNHLEECIQATLREDSGVIFDDVKAFLNIRERAALQGWLHYIPAVGCWMLPMVRREEGVNQLIMVWLEVSPTDVKCPDTGNMLNVAHERGSRWLAQQGKAERVSAADTCLRYLKRELESVNGWSNFSEDKRLLLYERFLNRMGLLNCITHKIDKYEAAESDEERELAAEAFVWWEGFVLGFADGTSIMVRGNGLWVSNDINPATTYIFTPTGELGVFEQEVLVEEASVGIPTGYA